MDVNQAIASAQAYSAEVYADEAITNLGLEETEYNSTLDQWLITLVFARPWNTPRTRAQEVLENLGGVSPLKRSYKTVFVASTGDIMAMKDRLRLETAE